jgi:hypothetical protein
MFVMFCDRTDMLKWHVKERRICIKFCFNTASETDRTVTEAFGGIAIVQTETYEWVRCFKNGWDVSRWSAFWTTSDHNHDRKRGKRLTLNASFITNMSHQHRIMHDPHPRCVLVNITLQSEHPNILSICLQSLTYPQCSRKAAFRRQFIQRPGGVFDCDRWLTDVHRTASRAVTQFGHCDSKDVERSPREKEILNFRVRHPAVF